MRHGISRLPEVENKRRTKKTSRSYPPGYVHLDIAEVRTEEGKLDLFVAIDRTSKVAYAELHPRATKLIVAGLLSNLIEVVPKELHTVLTDNGVGFTNRRHDQLAGIHVFNRVCDEQLIEHRLTKPNPPWTNGQVERMNRTLKDATVKRYHYKTHQQLKKHLHAFLMAYHFAKRLKTLKGLTPYEFICASWQREPHRFRLDPHHHSLGLNS